MKNMRKLMSVILVLVCLCACVASAETVESPTKPAAVIAQVTTTVAVEGEEPFVVEVVETEAWSEPTVQLFEEITQVLADPEVEPISIFTEEEMAAAVEILPPEFDTAELTVAEYIPLNIENYVPEVGDAAVQLNVPGDYAEEDVVIAMFKPFGGDESSWIALEVRVVIAEEGAAETAADEAAEAAGVTSTIEVVFTQEVLEMMAANEGALLILRG